MLITPHFLLGAAITKKTDSLIWGLPLAYASHFVLDLIPNWDVGLTSTGNICIIAIDGIVALLLIRLLSASLKNAYRYKIFLWAGGFFGILPDIMSQGSTIIGIQRWIPFENFHQCIQRGAHIGWSLPVQIFLSAILAGCIYYMAR